jgi:hypothetical protein
MQVPKRGADGWACRSDQDTLGTLTCAPRQIARREAGAWACANDLTPKLVVDRYSSPSGMEIGTECTPMASITIDAPGAGLIEVDASAYMRIAKPAGVSLFRVVLAVRPSPNEPLCAETVEGDSTVDEWSSELTPRTHDVFAVTAPGTYTYWLHASIPYNNFEVSKVYRGMMTATYYPN